MKVRAVFQYPPKPGVWGVQDTEDPGILPHKTFKTKVQNGSILRFRVKLFTFSKVLFSLEFICKMTYLILNFYIEIVSVGVCRKY